MMNILPLRLVTPATTPTVVRPLPNTLLRLEPRVQTVVRLLTADLQQHHTLEEIAAAVNLCARQLERLFKSETGFTPMQYLRRVRLEQARELLSHTTLSIKEIRLAVGIEDASHFTKDFKQAYGVTPTEYRVTVQRGRRHVGFRQ